MAPVTKRSGKSLHRRHALRRPGPAAQRRVPLGPRGRAERPQVPQPLRGPRARGHSYGRALRGVADRLLGVACALLQRQTIFDPKLSMHTAGPAGGKRLKSVSGA